MVSAMEASRPRGDLQLAIGYWIVSHKQTLRTWWAISFMFIMGACLLWMVFFFSVFFSQEPKVNEQLVTSANAIGGFHTSLLEPKPLEFGPVNVIPRDATHVDLMVDVTNPNAVWAAPDVVFHFTVNDSSLPPQRVFVNQSSRRPVLQVNTTVKDSTAVTATFVIDETNWRRASSGGLPEPKFTTAKLQTSPSTVTIDGQLRTSVTVTGEVTNGSVYNYYRVTVPIVLLNGDRVVGVSQIDQERWPTLSTRKLAVTFGYPVTDVTTIRVEPQVNRFDSTNIYR